MAQPLASLGPTDVVGHLQLAARPVTGHQTRNGSPKVNHSERPEVKKKFKILFKPLIGIPVPAAQRRLPLRIRLDAVVPVHSSEDIIKI